MLVDKRGDEEGVELVIKGFRKACRISFQSHGDVLTVLLIGDRQSVGECGENLSGVVAVVGSREEQCRTDNFGHHFLNNGLHDCALANAGWAMYPNDFRP